MKLKLVALLATLAWMGCGGHEAQGEPVKPYYGVSEMGVDTGSFLVLDANGDLWSSATDVGHSQPLTVFGHATGAQKQRVVDAFSRLPPSNSACYSHTTLSYVTVASTTTWAACGDDRGSFLEPYADAVEALDAL